MQNLWEINIFIQKCIKLIKSKDFYSVTGDFFYQINAVLLNIVNNSQKSIHFTQKSSTNVFNNDNNKIFIQQISILEY